jgi:hypothetical protein
MTMTANPPAEPAGSATAAHLHRITLSRLAERRLPESAYGTTLLEVFEEVDAMGAGAAAEASARWSAEQVAERLGCSLRRAQEIVKEIREEAQEPPPRYDVAAWQLAAWLVRRWERLGKRPPGRRRLDGA